MKRFLRCMVALLLVSMLGCACAEFMEDPVAAAAFESRVGGFYDPSECFIRARYRIELPEDTSQLHEQILEAYEGCGEIQLIEFGVPGIGGIVTSVFACVGTGPDGELKNLLTPMELLGRIYDESAFDLLSIAPVALSADS